MSEVVKFPLIVSAIASFGGGISTVLPTFKMAFTSRPFANSWIALCYTFNNLLYFDALSSLSAVAYQVLSQSKTLFTAGLMYFIVGKRLLLRQVAAVAMLVGGALLVQWQEMSRMGAASAVAGSAASTAVMWGAAAVLFSSFISALPNVYYEKILKTEGENQWVNNVQVTCWIIAWIAVSAALPGTMGFVRAAAGGSLQLPGLSSIPSPSSALATLRGAFDGFTFPVWGVVFLKALNGLIIPATFKYADNILYSYAKPSSIVVTTLAGALIAGVLPAPSLVVGVVVVVGSIFLYSSQPKAKDQAKAE